MYVKKAGLASRITIHVRLQKNSFYVVSTSASIFLIKNYCCSDQYTLLPYNNVKKYMVDSDNESYHSESEFYHPV